MIPARTSAMASAALALVALAGIVLAASSAGAQAGDCPAWAALVPVALADSDATRLRTAAARFYAAASGRSPANVAPLLAEPLDQLVKASPVWDPARQRVIAVPWVGDPFTVSPGVAAVRAAVTRRVLDGQSEGRTWGRVEQIYFELSDPKCLVWLDGSSVTGMHFGPTKPVEWLASVLVNPRFGDSARDVRKPILSLFSTKWPGWSGSEDDLWPRIVEWAVAQMAAYGPPARSEATDYRPCVRYVGAWGQDAVVEREFRHAAGGDVDILVTLRFLVTREQVLPYDSDAWQRPGNDWRIAGACAVKAETTKPTNAPLPQSCASASAH